jgi:hypothetical protein
MKKQITFRTFKKYCIHQRGILCYYNNDNILDWRYSRTFICNHKNCPVWKHLKLVEKNKKYNKINLKCRHNWILILEALETHWCDKCGTIRKTYYIDGQIEREYIKPKERSKK